VSGRGQCGEGALRKEGGWDCPQLHAGFSVALAGFGDSGGPRGPAEARTGRGWGWEWGGSFARRAGGVLGPHAPHSPPEVKGHRAAAPGVGAVQARRAASPRGSQPAANASSAAPPPPGPRPAPAPAPAPAAPRRSPLATRREVTLQQPIGPRRPGRPFRRSVKGARGPAVEGLETRIASGREDTLPPQRNACIRSLKPPLRFPSSLPGLGKSLCLSQSWCVFAFVKHRVAKIRWDEPGLDLAQWHL
jgi:hypothetical protein